MQAIYIVSDTKRKQTSIMEIKNYFSLEEIKKNEKRDVQCLINKMKSVNTCISVERFIPTGNKYLYKKFCIGVSNGTAYRIAA
jgi:hypothetical protein